VRTTMSLLTGVVVWSFALVAGIELATAWGVIAFVLNYIPFLGLVVFFWSFLWGIVGAFIGLPITIAILTICEQHKSTEWIALLLSAGERKSAR